MTSIAKLLLRLDGSSPSESVALARMFLTSADLRPLAERAARVSASEATRLWGSRSKNVKFTLKPIHGVEWLLCRLKSLNSEDELEQFSFTGRDFAGSLFFSINNQEFVGVAFVDRESAGDENYGDNA